MKPSSGSVKHRILEAAGHLFAEFGYDNVSTRQIAEQAMVQHGSIYYHFTSKEILYEHVFRKVYSLDQALTCDVLRQQEPMAFDTPHGKAYAIQRIVFDYFHRHVFISEEWKIKLIYRELLDPSSVFRSYVEKKLKDETDQMTEFYYALCPEGAEADAFYWSQLPCAVALYYFMTLEFVEHRYDKDFIEELNRTIIKRTAKLMILFHGLPLPQMLEE